MIGCSVNLVVIIENKILLLRRVSKTWMDGKLQIPGGHVEIGESPITATLREAKEELGINIKINDIKYFAAAQVNENGNEYVAYQFMLQNPTPFKYEILEYDLCYRSFV